MRPVVISIDAKRYSITERHLANEGMFPKRWEGFDNVNKWHLATKDLYEFDNPKGGFRIKDACIGILLGHVTLWKALDWAAPRPYYHIMEDDVRLRPGWKEQFDKAMSVLPDDWDILYPGSGCAEGEAEHVAENLYRAKPQCLHWYVVRHKALKTLIKTNQIAWAPIDVQMIFRSFPFLKVYAVLPRIADQCHTTFPD
jgi:GR25 family glycosyltransferase involved in LPS biosynthesis